MSFLCLHTHKMFLQDHKNTTVIGTINTIIPINIIASGRQLSRGFIFNAMTREFHMELCLLREGFYQKHQVRDSGGIILVFSITCTDETRQHNVFFQKLQIFSAEQFVSAKDPKSMIKHDLVTTMSVKANTKNNGFWY